MKKTKLLMPVLGVGAVAATVAPMVAMTGCNKGEEEVIDVLSAENLSAEYNEPQKATIILKWNGWTKGQKETIKIIDFSGRITFADNKSEDITVKKETYAEIEGKFNDGGSAPVSFWWSTLLMGSATATLACKYQIGRKTGLSTIDAITIVRQ
ncbi:MAG: hypothetical protein ACOQNV_03320 [Mycoplasmoidaceae bacterium]